QPEELRPAATVAAEPEPTQAAPAAPGQPGRPAIRFAEELVRRPLEELRPGEKRRGYQPGQRRREEDEAARLAALKRKKGGGARRQLPIEDEEDDEYADLIH